MDAREFRESKAIEELRTYGHALAESVPSQKAEITANRLVAKRHLSLVPEGGTVQRRGQSRYRRLAAAFMALGLLAISNVSLAAIANSASPGDFLYPIDRGYEWLGDLVGPTDRISERLAEANQLSERGETVAAVELLLQTVEEGSSNDALLVATIERLEEGSGQGSGQGQGPGQGSGSESPSATAPGQTDNGQNSDGQNIDGQSPNETGIANSSSDPASPSVTAPGQSEQPGQSGDTAPGQVDKEDQNPSVTAPGQNRATTTTTPSASTTAPSNGNGNGNAGGNGNGNNGNG
jgi:hypothetical protein